MTKSEKQTECVRIRTTSDLLQGLAKRAAKAGKTRSALVREILEREADGLQVVEELAELRGQVQALVVLTQAKQDASTSVDAELKAALRELLLIARETALEQNAQIVVRVAAQLKTKP